MFGEANIAVQTLYLLFLEFYMSKNENLLGRLVSLIGENQFGRLVSQKGFTNKIDPTDRLVSQRVKNSLGD